MDRAASSISDEIKINSVKGVYDPQKAQHKARLRRMQASFKGKKIATDSKLRAFVDGALSDGQSPEAIAGRLKYQEKHLPLVAKDTIYKYLKSPYGKLIGIKWKKASRHRNSRKVSQLKERVFIDRRPKIIEKRIRVGDMEADFIVSGKTGKGVLLTAVCRKLRVSFLELIPEVSVDEVHAAFVRIKQRIPEMRTATLDNDILFKMHKTLEKLLGIQIYFCHAYHSWEKGSIENVNKAVRKFIPKGSNLSKYDPEYIQSLEEHLNERYMECLEYKTPQEKLNEYRKNKKQLLKADQV